MEAKNRLITAAYVIAVIAAIVLWGCAGKTAEAEEEGTGLADPASVYCEQHGGTLVIVEAPKGQAGYCRLADGSVCEEWAYFRSDGEECVPLE